MGTSVLSLRIDHDLLERLRHHAAKSGMSVQDYVVRTLIRNDFDQRFQAAVEETERFYGSPDSGDEGPDHVRPSAGIR
ncbi:ribbon-helix-helix protein, CopG family [Streptomyces sp. enrichment culture]|uniref:ribbon-helix-helix protein, CopG family n=1 Tax=Streptomyces sp. enrichment culture TaxID=1795815 RepID=UPI003F55469D